MYITLRCKECDNQNCKLGRYFIPDDSLEGCTRQVSNEQALQFYHYFNEVLPFIKTYSNPLTAIDKLNEIGNFIQTVYGVPIGALLDTKGKVKKQFSNNSPKN